MIPGLDGLRALAFLAVLGGHADILPFGWIGVQLFFVLSGFLITGILLRMKDSLDRRDYFVKFYGRRFLRIVPLYYFYLLVLFGINLLAPHLDFKPLTREFGGKFWIQVWPAVFYVYDFFHTTTAYEHSRFFTHLWSLSVEEQFYILWPLILFITPKERLKNLFLTTVMLGPVIRALIYVVYVNPPFAFMTNAPEIAAYALPFSHVDAFAIGAYASQFEIPRPRLQFITALILVPLIGLMAQYFVNGRASFNTLGQEFPLSIGYKEIWGYSLLNYLFAVTIYSVARTALFNRILDSAPLRYLGKISYGLYVYHTAVIWFILKLNLFDAGTGGLYLLGLLVTTIIASLSYILLERPINGLKDKLFPLS